MIFASNKIYHDAYVVYFSAITPLYIVISIVKTRKHRIQHTLSQTKIISLKFASFVVYKWCSIRFSAWSPKTFVIYAIN